MLNLQLLKLAKKITKWYTSERVSSKTQLLFKMYPVPRGGVPVALALVGLLKLPNYVTVILVDSLKDCDIVVDDIVDSGNTKQEILNELKTLKKVDVPFFALLDHSKLTVEDRLVKPWVVFPWESVNKEQDDTIVGTLRNRAAKNPTESSLLLNYALTEDEANALRLEQDLRFKKLMNALMTDNL